MKVLLLGGGGFALEVADLLDTLGHEVGAVYVDAPGEVRSSLAHLQVASLEDAAHCSAACVAIGYPPVRRKMFDAIAGRFSTPTFVHPSAMVSRSARIGDGCLLMQKVIVNADAQIGSNSIINVGACVAHEARVGSHCHVAPAVQFAGCSSAGDEVLCGTGTSLLPGVSVGDRCVCGAGTIVTKDIPDDWTVVGVPARRIS